MDILINKPDTLQKGPSADTLRALETAPGMYLVLSPDLYILTASDFYLEATETSRAVIVGKHIFNAFPPDPGSPDADGAVNINASLQEVLKTKKPHHMPIQRYDVPDHKNPGKFIQRYWEPSHTPVLNDQGDIQYIIQLANNVTDKVLARLAFEKAEIEHQQVRERLQKVNEELEKRIYSERHFRQLADLIPAKISNSLPSGEVTYFNKQWLDYTKLLFEELRDFGYHNIMHPDEITKFREGLKEAAINRVPFEMEMRFLNTEGEYRWHLNIASPVFDDNGDIMMWVGSTTDIGRMKEDEQRKTDFIAMVSHELKTPLTSLYAYLQILQSKSRTTEDTVSSNALNKSLLQVRKMKMMINGFLNVSRLESGKMDIQKQRFNMAELVNEIKGECIDTITSHNVIFAPVEETFVYADRDKIGHIIINFISNAAKYSALSSTINIACHTINDYALVSVRDEGIGVASEDIDKLFHRYYRVKNNNNISGFGIGLYLCTEIIQRHNGKIWVESDPGKGSVFYFSLPIITEA